MSTATAEAGGVRTGTTQGRWVLAATVAASGLVMLDATVVNVALARIGNELDVGFAGLQWISNAYTLTLASFILIGGVLGDRYGRRRVFLIGTVWFALASVLCAVSVNEQMLIAARALQGVGGALVTPGSLAIISSTFVRTDRAKAIGVWSGLGGIASAAGPFVGGWLVQSSWRLVFVINLPLAVAVLLISLRHVPESKQTGIGRRPMDLPGSMILVGCLGSLTYGLTTAGESGWTLPAVGGSLVGALAAVGFVLWERTTTHPLVPPSIFANRVFSATNVVTVFLYAALSVYFFLLVIQLQAVSGWSPLAAGMSLLPSTLLMLLLSARSGALSERIGPRPLMTAGALLAAAGFVLAVPIGADARYLTDVLPSVVLLGLGLSCAVAPLTAAALGSVGDDLAGAASGINNAVARTAGLLAVVIIPAIAGLSSVGLGDVSALSQGFGTSMIIGAALLVVGAVVAWFGVGRQPESTPVPDDRVAVHRYSQCPVTGPGLHPRD